jgi:hypothetical protein
MPVGFSSVHWHSGPRFIGGRGGGDRGDAFTSTTFDRIPPKLPPFHGFADIVYNDVSARLSVSTSISAATSTWKTSNSGVDDEARNACEIHVQEFEARLDSWQPHRHPLQLQELKLNIGPSLGDASTNQLSRLITAHFQRPNMRPIAAYSTYRESGPSVIAGYPHGISVDMSARRTEEISYPPDSVGLNFENIQVGIGRESILLEISDLPDQ